jgi:hypothetical protein
MPTVQIEVVAEPEIGDLDVLPVVKKKILRLNREQKSHFIEAPLSKTFLARSNHLHVRTCFVLG